MESETEESATEERAIHRSFQRLVDYSFWQALEDSWSVLPSEVRLEAAFRTWLRELNVRGAPPRALPDESALVSLANSLDLTYGEDEWWQWAIWSSCARCREQEQAACTECAQLVSFCSLATRAE